jgi:hypothetical protein
MKRADAKRMYSERTPTHYLEEDPVVVTSTHKVRHMDRWVTMCHVIHRDGQACNVMMQDLRRIKK